MFKIALCDDDVEFMENAKQYICSAFMEYNTWDEDIECICYKSGNEIIQSYLKDEIDIVFMDIECGKMNGFDIAKELYGKKKDIGIVYMTDYAQYISKAFVCRPLGFINKSNFKEELVFPLLNIVEFLQDRRKEIIFTEKGEKYNININEIKVVEIFDHRLLVTMRTKKMEIRSQLSQYEEELIKNNFVKISRSVLINLKYINKIDGQDIFVDGNMHYGISRERAKEVYYQWVVYQSVK